MSEKVRRYQQAIAEMDFETLRELRHPEFVCDFPQSGERITGHDNWVAAHREYAELSPPPDAVLEAAVKGDERTTAVIKPVSPLSFFNPIVHVADEGNVFTLEGKGLWPDGKTYHWILILEYRNGLVFHETDYFAESFEAPPSRAPYVEEIPEDRGHPHA
jgi:hypothetical protein